jgi:hypothetical protein
MNDARYAALLMLLTSTLTRTVSFSFLVMVCCVAMLPPLKCLAHVIDKIQVVDSIDCTVAIYVHL